MRSVGWFVRVVRLLSFGLALTLMLSDDLAVTFGLNEQYGRMLAILGFALIFVLGSGIAKAVGAIFSPFEAMKRVFDRRPPEE